MQTYTNALLELDKLKSVYRKSYVTDATRHENTAEHSWHLALSFLALKPLLPKNLDIDKAIKMALVHDVCEIGAGDVCAYRESDLKAKGEARYLDELTNRYPWFGSEVKTLWEEYEAQQSIESQWVKVFDKLLPFLLNIAGQGKTWRQQNINREMVLTHNAFIAQIAPDVHHWMLEQIEVADMQGWFSC